MAQQQYTLFKKFIGYGHYKLIIADKEGTRMEGCYRRHGLDKQIIF